ncbi:hypothetical protein ACFLT2_13230 [Acidobacteriota bacterium]
MKKILIFLIVCAFFLTTPLTGQTTWTVDAGGGEDFTTIQAAINAASDGDTIIVVAGTYLEHIIVNKGVSILAKEGDNPIVDGSGTLTCFGIYKDVGLNGVTIDGFEIQNATYGIWTYGAPSTYANIILSNNNIHDHTNGIYVTDATINALTISGNTVENCDFGVAFANNSTVNGLLFDTNRIINNQAGAGLSLISSAFSNVLVTNCHFEGNAWEHIDLGLWGNYPTLSNISITGCTFLSGPAWCDIYVQANFTDNTDVIINFNEFPLSPHNWGIFNGTTNIVDGRFNWWDDVSGPYNDGNTDGLGLINLGAGDIVTEYVLYDPWIGQGGFVTGGGTIWSEMGDYAWAPEAEGQANFGFVAKYKKGANTPDGNTNFVFQAGNLHFQSTEYDWLVIAGKTAQFKGKGTIEGVSGLYKFKLWGTDDDPDTFRIKIWEEVSNTEVVIYDNGGDPLTGGNIFIHKEKNK